MPPGYDEACYAIGRLTIVWAGLEEVLFGVLHYLYHERGGDKLLPEIPEALSRRVRFLKTCSTSLDLLDMQRQRGLALADQITALSDRRHWCIHGVVTNALDRQLGDILEFRRIHRKTHTSEQEKMTLHDLSEACIDIEVLTMNLFFFKRFWLEGRSYDEIDEMLSKIRR